MAIGQRKKLQIKSIFSKKKLSRIKTRIGKLKTRMTTRADKALGQGWKSQWLRRGGKSAVGITKKGFQGALWTAGKATDITIAAKKKVVKSKPVTWAKKWGGKVIRSPYTKAGGIGLVGLGAITISGKLTKAEYRRDPEKFVDKYTKRGYITKSTWSELDWKKKLASIYYHKKTYTKGKGLGETIKRPYGGHSRTLAHRAAAELIYSYKEPGLTKTKDKPYVGETYQKDKPTVDRNQVVGTTRTEETTYNQDMPDKQKDFKITGQDAFKITQGKKDKRKKKGFLFGGVKIYPTGRTY